MRIGVDLGGSKIEVIALDAAGHTRLRRRMPTPVGDYDATLAAVVDLVAWAEAETGARTSVGVGTPGAISPATGLIKNANSVCLNGRRLQEDLERALGRPILIANDADCFTLSEAVDGAGAGARTVFGVIVGTGTGGGIVIDGRLVQGPNAIAGEWGHNPLPWPREEERPGPACYCGKHGCIETYLSGPGLSADHRQATDQVLTARLIAERAAQGDPECSASLERYVDRMARGLATVINLLDPQVIVLGGGLSHIASLYQAVPAQWGRYVFSDTVGTRLVKAVHGDSSGVRGAAWLWPAGGL